MCVHTKRLLMTGVYEIHYGCSCFLPPALEKEPSLCCLRTGTSVGVTGPGVILIKRIFICVLLICMAEAVGEREGRNELGENEWIKLERLETGYETVMQWCMICMQVECFMGLCKKKKEDGRDEGTCLSVCTCLCIQPSVLWGCPQTWASHCLFFWACIAHVYVYILRNNIIWYTTRDLYEEIQYCQDWTQ